MNYGLCIKLKILIYKADTISNYSLSIGQLFGDEKIRRI